MSALLLVIILILSFLIIRIGAVALELTGMDIEHAKFQSLSAFTGTGFTTREAESVVNHPQRRRIVSYLMILGNAGIVSLIGAFLISLRSDATTSWFSLAAIVLVLLILWRLAANARLMRRLTQVIRSRLSRTDLVELTLEEIVHQQEGFGVARIVIPDCSPLINLSLAEAQFPAQHIVVLSIQHEGHLTPVPPPTYRLAAFDELVCYGRLAAMQVCLGACEVTVPSHVAERTASQGPDDDTEMLHV
jgi:hypothetical protein